jgi:hypothetical protein
MLTKNQVNFFEGGSINKSEMAFELSKSLDLQGVSNNHEAYTNKNNT